MVLPVAPAALVMISGDAVVSEHSLLALRRLDRRVLVVSWTLGEAVSAICSHTRYDPGWRLHGLGLYRPGLRSTANVHFALDSNRLSVLTAAPGGPASQAAVAENDVLLAVADQPVVLQSAADRPDHEAVERATEEVETLTDRPSVRVRVLRAGREFDLTVHPRRRCDWNIEVTPSRTISAGADGYNIAITSRLVDLAEQDDVLAFVLAHEMAHNLQRERPDFAARPIREREREADRIGMILASRAGYDTSGAGDFVRSLGRISWFSRFGWGAHDAPAVRAAALDRLHDEIVDKGASALPLGLEQAPDYAVLPVPAGRGKSL